MAGVMATMRRWAHEQPVYFYSCVIGATGPLMAITVPPIRRRMGYKPAPAIPISYPLPQQRRTLLSTEFDDPAPTSTTASTAS